MPSLSVTATDDGAVLLHCFASSECSVEAIVATLGLSMGDLFPDADGAYTKPRPVSTQVFAIRSASGAVVAEHVRTNFDDGGKTYSWRRNGRPGLHGLSPTDLPLYGMPAITTTEPGSTVLLVEGEKATDALTRNGAVAFGTVTGANTIPSDTVLEQLRGFDVILWADNDQPGRTHVRRIGDRLVALGLGCRVLTWADAPASGDAADYFAMGGTTEGLRALMTEATILDSRFGPIGNPPNRASEDRPIFRLTPLADLMAEPEPDTAWLVDGILPASGVSLLAAKPKVGKSTLARNLALAVASGEPFLGRAVTQGAVVYLALEEKRDEVAKHFARMGAISERIFVHVGAAPKDALAALAAAIQEHRPVLVIVDPLFRLIRIRDANDYAEASRELAPLMQLARDSGAHIVCVHHLGKGERTGGDAILGSTGYFAAVDTALLMKRRDDRRTLESIQRYGTDLAETVIVMDADTGRITDAGELSAVQVADMATSIISTIGDGALTEQAIKEQMGGNQTTVSKAIRALVADGRLSRSGEGVKGSPFVYAKTVVVGVTNGAGQENLLS
jgi:hypothetical protein